MTATPTGPSLTFTTHCLQRMLHREVSIDEVRHAIGNYEHAYLDRKHEGKRAVYRRGDIAVVVALDSSAILTVLYWQKERWHSSDGRPSGLTLANDDRNAILALLRDGGPFGIAA